MAGHSCDMDKLPLWLEEKWAAQQWAAAFWFYVW